MKKIALPVLILAAMVLSACGSSSSVATIPAATQAPATQPAATEPPTQPAASTGATTAPSGATEVTISLADNTIAASQTNFQVGVPYTFVITNNGNRIHDFNINPPVSVAGSIDAALAQALLVVTKDQLNPGATATVQYTFPESAAGQQLEFSCLIQRHYEDGMHVAITVTK